MGSGLTVVSGGLLWGGIQWRIRGWFGAQILVVRLLRLIVDA